MKKEDQKRIWYKVRIEDKKDIARLAINFLNCPQLKKRNFTYTTL